MSSPQVLLIEGCDFDKFPVGGQLTFIKQVVSAYGDQLALVGLTAKTADIGKWTKTRILGQDLLFFGIGKSSNSAQRPLIPRRFAVYWSLRKHRDQILSLGVNSAYIHSPEVFLAVQNWSFNNICYHFHGTENPLSISRYRWARRFSEIFERVFFRALGETADIGLVSADKKSIAEMRARSHGYLDKLELVSFPTRVDTQLFAPNPQSASGDSLKSRSHSCPVFVNCGRLNAAKGWPLLIDAFRIVLEHLPSAHLLFIGDGEDRERLETKTSTLGLSDSVSIIGMQTPSKVAALLRSADVFVSSSRAEGWSVAMLEALATGLPVVSTAVSATDDLVREGLNGFVVPTRDAKDFAMRMLDALALPNPNSHSLEIAENYAASDLSQHLAQVWNALNQTQESSNR